MWKLHQGTDWYLGKKYIHQGSWFPCVGKSDEAKTYKTKAMADRVSANLLKQTGERFDVVEVSLND